MCSKELLLENELQLMTRRLPRTLFAIQLTNIGRIVYLYFRNTGK